MRKLLFKTLQCFIFIDQGMYRISTVAMCTYVHDNAIHVANYL